MAAAMAYYKLPIERVVVIHDEMDLEFGKRRGKQGGGSAGHNGIRSIDDPDLLRRLADQDVLLEVCPTSNWITSAVPALSAHPLPALIRAGVPVCLNSDDPNLFGIDLVHEYEVCVSELGLGEKELRQMNRDALRHSFLPEAITLPLRDAL